MSREVHIAGDGVAALALAARLRAAGARPTVYGDGGARTGSTMLVHRYAGRSFRSSPLEEEAWAHARPWLQGLVDGGAARTLTMVRPVSSAAGERLEGSFAYAQGVQRQAVSPFGDAFVYGPAFVVDVDAALGLLGADVEHVAGRTSRADAVYAVGADIQLLGVARYGGQTAEFEGTLSCAVSGGGVHAVPTATGVHVGATFWPAHTPLCDAEAVAELRRRAAAIGLQLGELHRVWSGVRAVNQVDRIPVVGEVDGRFVVAALGTRGWYWAALLAEVATKAILHDAPIPPALDVRRIV